MKCVKRNATYKHMNNNNNNTTISQCGSRFRGAWGDADVGSFTSTSISTCRKADSTRPTKDFCANILQVSNKFYEIQICYDLYYFFCGDV